MQPGYARARQGIPKLALTRPYGFSLIELMVTIAIVAILITLAAPSFTALINRNRLSGQANELVGSLQLARMEAVRRNARVSMCKTTDGATCSGVAGPWSGWLVVVASDGEVLRASTVKAPVRVTSGATTVTFRANGMMAPTAAGLLSNDINVCIPTTQPVQNQRLVSVVTGSRISSGLGPSGACP